MGGDSEAPRYACRQDSGGYSPVVIDRCGAQTPPVFPGLASLVPSRHSWADKVQSHDAGKVPVEPLARPRRPGELGRRTGRSADRKSSPPGGNFRVVARLEGSSRIHSLDILERSVRAPKPGCRGEQLTGRKFPEKAANQSVINHL